MAQGVGRKTKSIKGLKAVPWDSRPPRVVEVGNAI